MEAVALAPVLDDEIAPFPIEGLERDPSYQREPNEMWIKYIQANWDDRVARVFNVAGSLRPDGRRVVIDGWHKVQAARGKGITHLWMVVFQGLTLEDEAQLFADLNRNRRLPKQWDMFHSLLTARDGAALAIDSITKRHGYYCAPRNDTVDAIQAIGALFDVYRRGGEVVLDTTLTVVRAAWPDEDDAKEGTMLRALSRLVQTAQAQGKPIDIGHLTERLHQTSAHAIVKKAREYVTPGVGGSNSMIRAVALALGVTYNKGLRSRSIDLHDLTDLPRRSEEGDAAA